MRAFVLIFTALVLTSCSETKQALTAEEIVSLAIGTACNGNCETAEIKFDFRGRHYKSNRREGSFIFERLTNDSIGEIKDVLTNIGFNRYVNDSLVQVVDSMAVKYANSVNSVHYFAQLPYGLSDPAVKLKLQGESTVKEKKYYEVAVTFNQERGGKDYEDEFMYWINMEEFTVDYIAYRYLTDGGGVRFREAFNPRVVNGIRFVDYNNYKPDSLEIELSDLDTYYIDGKLELLSKIITENVEVSLN